MPHFPFPLRESLLPIVNTPKVGPEKGRRSGRLKAFLAISFYCFEVLEQVRARQGGVAHKVERVLLAAKAEEALPSRGYAKRMCADPGL